MSPKYHVPPPDFSLFPIERNNANLGENILRKTDILVLRQVMRSKYPIDGESMQDQAALKRLIHHRMLKCAFRDDCHQVLLTSFGLETVKSNASFRYNDADN